MNKDVETDKTPRLPQALESFVLHWGELGNRWGVNRSVSQLHAYLYLSETPVTAEDICRELDMARSNVSNSLKELLAWNLVFRVPVRGDRREHFKAETDVWEIAARIAAGRKEREIDPAMTVLSTCLEQADGDAGVSKVQLERLQAMLEFTRTADNWYRQMLSLPKTKRAMIIKMGARIVNLLPGAKN